MWVNQHGFAFKNVHPLSYLLELFMKLPIYLNSVFTSYFSDRNSDLTSVSKKSGQTTVVIQYYSLSRFFWNTLQSWRIPKSTTFDDKVNIDQQTRVYWKSCLAKEICSRIFQKFQSEFQSDKQPAMPTY